MSAHFDNSYARLGDHYSSSVQPSTAANPGWMLFNDELANEISWPSEWRQSESTLEALAGNRLLAGSDPIATVYAGHQFGSYNPQLGDGRAILLGEWLTDTGRRVDIQLKGAGATPFSRGGDGRSPIGPVVREFLISEAMHTLGVPTTRALAAVATGERVYRTRVEPGAILTRVASSHLRIGTAQYFAMTQGGEGLSTWVDYVLERHYGEAWERESSATSASHSLGFYKSKASVLLAEVGKRLASLAAHWQSLGFIHGVLNTDNMLLCGETIDYGPCAFMDGHDPKRVFSSIDSQGRYAYGNQPSIVHWNLSVLAQCLLPLISDDEEQALSVAQSIVDAFPQQYTDAYSAFMAAKFGLDGFRPDDKQLVDEFFEAISADALDFTLAFRWLTETAQGTIDHTPMPELFTPNPALNTWLPKWQARRSNASEASDSRMAACNPVVIPRNHQIARAIEAAEAHDYSIMAALYKRLRAPAVWSEGDTTWAASPQPEEIVQRTFCGT